MSDPAVVIVNYASAEHTRAAAAPLRAAGIRVVVVDNLSTVADREAMRGVAGDLGLEFVEDANRGFGTGANLGVGRARDLGASVVILLNPDARMTPETAFALADRAAAGDGALVAPYVVDRAGRPWSAGGVIDRAAGWTRLDPARKDDPEWVTGACLAFDLAAWDAVGGFDDEFFMYWEDVELSVRWTASGRPIAVLPVPVVHEVGGTQGTGKSALYVYYNCRNRLLFAARGIPAGEHRVWRRSTVAYARRVVLRGGRRGLLRNPFRLIAEAVRGSLAGLALLRR